MIQESVFDEAKRGDFGARFALVFGAFLAVGIVYLAAYFWAAFVH